MKTYAAIFATVTIGFASIYALLIESLSLLLTTLA